MPNKGHYHRYKVDPSQLERVQPTYRCALCDDKYITHQEHLESFATGFIPHKYPNDPHTKVIKRLHSFDEAEKKELKANMKEQLDQHLRFRDVNKKFRKDQNQTFYCDICYMECGIYQITFLECGHYFCR